MGVICYLVTDCIRSMAESTVFTGMCHSFCPQGGLLLELVLRGWMCELRVGVWSGGGCLVWGLGVWSQEGE